MAKWIELSSGLYKCDRCGLIIDVEFYHCPNCGDFQENYLDDSPLRYWHEEYYFKWLADKRTNDMGKWMLENWKFGD